MFLLRMISSTCNYKGFVRSVLNDKRVYLSSVHLRKNANQTSTYRYVFHLVFSLDPYNPINVVGTKVLLLLLFFYLLQVNILLSENDVKNAEKILVHVRKRFPENVDVLVSLGLMKSAQAKFNEARTIERSFWFWYKLHPTFEPFEHASDW